ncbi:endonuclease 8-like 1 [Palaemon carinicauda]|uniref:endonuclease 8-like 1 n=1 Tax=Palaemon carinicauda TaxID=392227 RepID=UPI0035B60FA9
MPEGPEIFLASLFINTISKTRIYGGRVVKSEVSTKNPDVDWDYEKYRISAVARGKELKVTLTEGEEEKKNAKWIDILFRFGMSGSFKFTTVADLPKHAHLRFFTINEDKPMVLSFVDYRRFGRWEVGADWSPERGPDPMWEYESFRENIMSNLSSAAFNKPICEAMLNQKFFNGIGNYLRAEILYRCGVRPFDQAREVLEELKPFSHWYQNKVKGSGDCKVKMEECKVKMEEDQEKNLQNDIVQPDILDLCNIVPKEVINLEGGGKGYNVDPDADEEEYAAFREWLQCYNQDGMKNLVDGNKRTIWFSGEPGKLIPKGSSSRRGGDEKRKTDAGDEDESSPNKMLVHFSPYFTGSSLRRAGDKKHKTDAGDADESSPNKMLVHFSPYFTGSSRRGGNKKRKTDTGDADESSPNKKKTSVKKDQAKKEPAKNKDKAASQKSNKSNSKKKEPKAKSQKNNGVSDVKTEAKPKKTPKAKPTTQTPLRRSSRRTSLQSNGSV